MKVSRCSEVFDGLKNTRGAVFEGYQKACLCCHYHLESSWPGVGGGKGEGWVVYQGCFHVIARFDNGTLMLRCLEWVFRDG